MRVVEEGSHAIAEAVKLCAPKVIAAYPITPQTHIVERLSEMVANGELDAEFLNVESEHSAMSACIGAQATGVRTFTATASQGLALMWEMLYIASGMRLPIVMAVANRALSAPLNIWNDWSDSLGARDSGWIQLYCRNNQEAHDTIIQAYKIAEDLDVMLPVMVCVDGFYLTHTLEPFELISSVKNFLGDYKPKVTLDPEFPISQGEYAGPDYYQEFREDQENAMQKANQIIKKTNLDFGKVFGRRYGDGMIEKINMSNAKHAIITMGTLSETIEYVLKKEKIKDIGLIRLRSFRPFPAKEIQVALQGIKTVGVIEKDISPGLGGVLWSEVKTFTNKPATDFIAGLGGRDVTINEIKDVLKAVRKGEDKVYWVGRR